MIVQLESTQTFTVVNGARVRVWSGHVIATRGPHGLRDLPSPRPTCTFFVAGVAVPEGDTSPFDAELEETPAPPEVDRAVQELPEVTRDWPTPGEVWHVLERRWEPTREGWELLDPGRGLVWCPHCEVYAVPGTCCSRSGRPS